LFPYTTLFRSQISALGTAIAALYAAGGVTARANMRQIEIRRLDKVVATLDLYDYLLRGDKRDDIRLETGDVVHVPLHGTRVQVTGAVLRPAIYELKEGETLPDLLRAAGGVSAEAARGAQQVGQGLALLQLIDRRTEYRSRHLHAGAVQRNVHDVSRFQADVVTLVPPQQVVVEIKGRHDLVEAADLDLPHVRAGGDPAGRVQRGDACAKSADLISTRLFYLAHDVDL